MMGVDLKEKEPTTRPRKEGAPKNMCPEKNRMRFNFKPERDSLEARVINVVETNRLRVAG
jgi:hypothetical protein